ncbi:MAG: bifunctional oligoribonuclease/PAP phosphatase NrnA [Bacilli bacterium]|jgi:phosphoesterase RecJ-like protein
MRLPWKKIQMIHTLLQEYQTIVLFRHEAPDFDCLGAQFGLREWLRANFPSKRVYVLGETKVEVGRRLFPTSDHVSDEILKQSPFLAIVLDTSNRSRISDHRFDWADHIIKIDHHQQGEDYGDINIIMTESSATCELLFRILKSRQLTEYSLPREAARMLYVGIVGDTGRFQFSNTTPDSLKISAELLKYNFNLQDEVYMPIYNKDPNLFNVMKHILNHYVITPGKVAYYHLSQADLEMLGISSEEGKNLSYLFNYCDEILVWVAFAEDVATGLWRASIRSRDVIVNRVAARHRGGGHLHAAGARARTYEETLEIIRELEEEILENID